MRPIVLALPLLLSAATMAPALAHDDEGYLNESHAADHREHYRYHEQLSDAHQRAHEEGFESRAEHRAYHHAQRNLHEDFHEDHPNTWHDHSRRHYGYWRHWYGGAY